MFLWAKSVIHYLSDKSLTPRERLSSIYDSEIVEGVDNLYGKILQLLGKTSSELRKRKIRRKFQVMVATKSTLHMSELHYLATIVPGWVISQDG